MPYKIHRTRRHGEPLAKAFAGGVLALVLVAAAWLWLTQKPDRVRVPRPAMMLVSAPSNPAPIAEETKPFRLVYRNSVIPGGVHDATELAATLQRDPVAALHYANFNVAAARLVRVEKSRLAHVSYRIGDQIYWTKNKVLLTQGEDLLSDGTHLARARCGNRIADEPEGPVLKNEPAPEVLDTAFVSTGELIDQAPGIATGTTGSAPAAATTAAAATAQAFDTRLASTMQSLGMPASNFLNSASMRSPVQQALAPTVDPISLAPASHTQRFDPVVQDDPAVPGTSPLPPTVLPNPPNPPIIPPTIPTILTPTTIPTPPTTPIPTTVPTILPPILPPIPPPIPPNPSPVPQKSLIPLTPTSIPEPGSAALFGLALIALALVRFRAGKIRPS